MTSRDPDDVAAYDEEMAAVFVGDGPKTLQGRIEICEYDPAWPKSYGREATRIRVALGGRVTRLEHAGSTSVPGLPAKPIIDIVLEVPDSSQEAAYVADLVGAGYVLRIREPDWFEHRMFRGTRPDVHLHVFSADCPEVDRMLAFRDWLRGHAADRERYAEAKRALATRDWKYMQQYADAKSEVVAEIMAHAQAASA